MIDDAAVADFVRLNMESVESLAPMDEDGLRSMLRIAYVAAVTDGAALLAFDERAPYDNPNFSWFKQRYDRFAYVDRVVVDRHARNRGLARQLYERLYAQAKADGKPIVACEVYIDPANTQSLAFHERLGFERVGEAFLPERQKTVGYFIKRL